MINFDDFYKESYTEIINLDFNRQFTVRDEPVISKKRTCRFCNKSEPHITFRNKAHAIPELLGNKCIILRNECDECNKFFGNSYEQDLANILGALRTFHHIEGKSGVPKFKSKHYEIASSDNRINFKFNKMKIVNLTNYEVEIKKNKYTPINAAKALVKSAVSVLPSEYLSYCKETIQWIRWGKADMSRFQVWISVDNKSLNEASKVIILKHNPDVAQKVNPMFICILCIKGLHFQMTIPFCNGDIILGDNSITCMPPENRMKGKLYIKDLSSHEPQDDHKKLAMRIIQDNLFPKEFYVNKP